MIFISYRHKDNKKEGEKTRGGERENNLLISPFKG
jgi:hypothetical protein